MPRIFIILPLLPYGNIANVLPDVNQRFYNFGLPLIGKTTMIKIFFRFDIMEVVFCN